MSMNLIRKTNGDESPSTFEDVIASLSKALEVIKHKRKASQRARLRLIQIQADRAEGRRLDLSYDQQKGQVGFEDALEVAWAVGGLDAVDVEIEERRLTVRRLSAVVPIERARAAEALEKKKAMDRWSAAVDDHARQVAMRLGEEQAKIEKLEQEKIVYQRLAERIARGEHPKLWQGAGNPPQQTEFVPFTWWNFARLYHKSGLLGYHDIEEGRVRMADLEKAAAEETRRAKAEHEKHYRDQCEMARLRISQRELALLEEDTPKEAA